MKRREFLIASAALTGAGLPTFGRAQSPPTQAEIEADWLSRISAPGVVWFHDFRDAREVDAFRWLNGHGNDPNSVTEKGHYTRRITTDGIGSGGCMEIWREGTRDVQGWWRPFSPLKGGWPGNGKSADDPGATDHRHIDARPWDPTIEPPGPITPAHTAGYYGHASYHSLHPGQFDGTEYYLQVRVRVDPKRLKYRDGGKLFYFTRTDRSATDQEIVTISGRYAGGRNVFSMYRSMSPQLSRDWPGRGDQPGTELRGRFGGSCEFGALSTRACWAYSGGWDTLLYHVRPGRDQGADTLVQVWAAHPGEKSYTKIWDQPNVNLPFDSVRPRGHNALICSGYLNKIDTGPGVFHRYAQIIFSLDPIPCPQA